MACMEAAGRGEIDAAFCLGGNLFGSNPDSQFAANAMEKIDQVVYLSTTLNTGHAWGTGRETIVLPVLPRDEEPQPTTQESMFSFVRYSEGGPSRYDGPRSEVSILCEIGQRLFGTDGSPVAWSDMESHAAVRKLMGELIPEYDAVGNIDETKSEFHVPGRAVDEYKFPTESGKAKFHAVPLPQTAFGDGQLRLMSIRSEGQFNTVVYDEEDLYRGQERRDVILLNPKDIEQLGLKPDQRVCVKSDTGEMRNILARAFDVRSGTAVMYYPESNVLISRAVDPLSKTPAFKSVNVTITAEDG